MTPAIKVVLWTVLILVGAEFGLRTLDGPVSIDVSEDRPVLICLGTSRTTHGLAPLEIQAALEADPEIAHERPWVANASQNGITTVGLYLVYMKEVRPLMRGRKGVIAIEARPSGFNDAYMTEEENKAFTGNELRELYAGGDIRLDDFSEGGGARNRFAAFSEKTLGSLRLSGGRSLLGRLKGRFSSKGSAAFPKGERGFVPVIGSPREDLDIERWQYHYEKVLLNGWRFGAIQTLALRFLIRQIKIDGLTPVLYTMPVTDVQRTFWPPQALPLVMAGLHQISAEEGVDFINLDHAHGLPESAFQDTHHLTEAAARAFSSTFAERVFATRIPQ